jgi:hypothetical protein
MATEIIATGFFRDIAGTSLLASRESLGAIVVEFK